jgi:hypothetical protein
MHYRAFSSALAMLRPQPGPIGIEANQNGETKEE